MMSESMGRDGPGKMMAGVEPGPWALSNQHGCQTLGIGRNRLSLVGRAKAKVRREVAELLARGECRGQLDRVVDAQRVSKEQALRAYADPSVTAPVLSEQSRDLSELGHAKETLA